MNVHHKRHIELPSHHDEEHERWSRRSFLQALGLAGSGTLMLGGTAVSASRPSSLASAIANSDSDRILVLIRLKGGNDGLNTIIPVYDYDRYAQLRPNLRIRQDKLFKLNDDFGMPNTMKNLQPLWGEGAMKIIHGVGYQEQDLSHFKSSNIWANSDPSDEASSGFFGRYFEGLHPNFLEEPPRIPPALQIGSTGNLIFDGSGTDNYAVTVANPKELQQIGERGTAYSLENLSDCTYGDKVRYMRGIVNNTFAYSKVIFDAFQKGENKSTYDEKTGNLSVLGPQLSIVAKLIKGGLGTKVYMVTLDGFDTHATQAGTHQHLMTTLSNSVKAFFDDLKDTGIDQNVLAMTISEFGRRAQENGSAGTDHGAAAPLMLFGPALDANGFIGDHPSLNTLDKVGNLQYGIDFREIYAAVMKEWLCIDPNVVNEVLLDPLGIPDRNIGVVCNSGGTLTTSENVILTTVKHQILYKEKKVILSLQKENTSHTLIELYSTTGQKVATVVNAVLFSGPHEYNLSDSIDSSLSDGVYVYRIEEGGNVYSKQFML